VTVDITPYRRLGWEGGTE